MNQQHLIDDLKEAISRLQKRDEIIGELENRLKEKDAENARLKTEIASLKAERIRWAKQILIVRDELAKGNSDEAYHQLYAIGSPNYDILNPWEVLEQLLNPEKK